MASKRKRIQLFEDWAGVDYLSSDLTRANNAFKDLTNIQFSRCSNLTGRRGFQIASPKVGAIAGHTYSYLDRETGETKEEILLANKFLWRYVEQYGNVNNLPDSGAINISYTSAPGDYCYFKMDVNSNGYYEFKLYEVISGNTSLALTYNCGTGTEALGVVKTIKDLQEAIDALPRITATVSYSIKVNGTQSNVSTITVDAGYTFGGIGTQIQFYDSSTNQLVVRTITGATATTISFNSAFGNVSVVDNQQLTVTGTPAACLSMTDIGYVLAVHGSSGYLYVPHLEPVKFNESAGSPDALGPLQWQDRASYLFNNTRVSFCNANDVCYIAQSSTPLSREVDDSRRTDNTGKLLKYDGNRVYRAGMPRGELWEDLGVSVSAGSNTWRYLTTYEYTDHQGNIVEGNPSKITTVTSAATPVTVTLRCLQGANDWFNTAGAKINGAQSGAGTSTSLTVHTGHTLQVGDKVVFYDANTSGLVTRTLTGVSTTQIAWDFETDVSVANNAPISNGLLIKLWRTKNNGVDFYLVSETPNLLNTATINVTDSVADADLEIKYSFPEIGFEHDLPPAVNHIAEHQGILVGTKGANEPNTVFWSTSENLEYWPISANSLDLPSTVSGPITGVGVDSDSRLTVFKKNAIYSINGDLELGAFTIVNITEGDYGLISHTGLTKVKGMLMGVGEKGIFTVKDGQFNNNPGFEIRPAFDQPAELQRAYLVNDRNGLKVRLWAVDTFSVIKGFVGDYEDTLTWFNWDYSSNVRPKYGMVAATNDLFNVGSDYLFREIKDFKESDAEDPKLYHDNCESIAYTIETKAFHFGSPTTWFTPLRLTIFAVPDYADNVYVQWNPVVRTIRNIYWGTHTDSRELFFQNEDFQKEVNLKSGKTRFLGIKMSTNIFGERPMISGLDLLVSLNYDDEENYE